MLRSYILHVMSIIHTQFRCNVGVCFVLITGSVTPYILIDILNTDTFHPSVPSIVSIVYVVVSYCNSLCG